MPSWVEDPGAEIVGDYVLEELEIDQAFVNVSSETSQQLWLYSVSTTCIKCPFQLVRKLTSAGNVLKVSTVFPTKYRFRLEGTSPTVEYDKVDKDLYCETDELALGEFGIYDLKATSDISSSSSCYELKEVHEPVGIYYAFIIAFLVYLFLGLSVFLWGYLKKRKEGKKTKTEPMTETSNGDASNGVPAPAKVPASPPQRQRLRSLDTFRGICIIVMIFVNDGGAGYYFLEHAHWDGLYVADLVFPWFLWIMGVCIPMSIKSSRKRNTPRLEIISKILIRSLKLIGIGLILASLWGPVDLRELRIPGVLQRFGVTYFVCSILVLFFMDVDVSKVKNKYLAAVEDIKIIWVGWLVALLILALHTILTFFLPVPDCPTGYLGPGGLHDNGIVSSKCIGGAAGYIDRQIFTPKHIYQWPTSNAIYVLDGQEQTPYDPEGLLGTLTSIFQVWCGVQTGVTMLVFPGAMSRVKRWLAWGVLLGGLGTLLCQAKETGGWIPVNKNLWSLSFVLVTSCFANFLLSFMYFVIDMKKWWGGSPFYEPGMNSILLYVGHSVGNSCLPWHWAYGRMQTHGIRLFESLWGTSVWVVIAIYLNAKKMFWIL